MLAYLKLRQNPAIDLFLIHRYIDIPFDQEYGLNLGLRNDWQIAWPVVLVVTAAAVAYIMMTGGADGKKKEEAK